MALAMLADTTRIQVAAGFESGHTMVFVQADPSASFEQLYTAKPHSQPGELSSQVACLDHSSDSGQSSRLRFLLAKTISSHQPQMLT